jgi:cell division transport system permease protein
VPQDLHELFERALDGEPVPPPGDLAQLAMTGGRRIRRRRGLLAGGSAAALAVAVVVGLNLAPGPAEPPQTVPAGIAAAMPPDPACTWPVQNEVSDVSIFLTSDVTDAQRAALNDALRTDPLVRELRYESRAEAYERFKRLWRDSPDFVASVGPQQLPESFRVQLTDASGYRRLAETFRYRPGVQDLIGRVCPGPRR